MHLIGINESDTNLKSSKLFYYGYLDKGVKDENEIYYKLISESKVIVNTTEDWGAFSSMTEAMYFYTPVITSPYKEFTETYGTEINFGYYITKNSIALGPAIEELINMNAEKYSELMFHAHEGVKDFTWNNYIDKILNLVHKELS